MKKIILACLMALFACNLKAQTNVDSLVNVLNTQKLTAEEQLTLYDEICREYRDRELEKFILYSNKGLQLAEQEKNTKYVLSFNQYIGESYFFRGIYDTALVYYKKILDLSVKTNDEKMEAITYASMGNVYLIQKNDSTALTYYMKSLLLFEKLGTERNQIGTLINISSICLDMQSYDRAVYYIEKAKAINGDFNDPYANMQIYDRLGRIYYQKRVFDLALEYYSKALEISRSIGHIQAEILMLQQIASIYCEESHKDFDKAEKYALESLHIAEAINNSQLICAAWAALSYIYLYQERYNESDSLATKAMETDTTDLGRNFTLCSNIIVSNIYLGNKEKALYFFNKIDGMYALYSGKNHTETLAEKEVKYETEKKEMRIAALEKEKTLYTWIIIISAVATLLAFGILFFRHKLNIQKRRQAEQQIKQLEQEKQLVATQAIIDGEAAERSRLARDLHDGLGGMLSAVKLNLKDMKGYSVLDNFDIDHFNKAIYMLDQSIDELRRVAHHIMPESLMRYGLKTSLDDFCRAISVAHFRFFGDDSGLDNRLKILVYRCAYELINNAVKHANATSINVQLMIDNGLVSLSVHDDGTGFDPEKVTKGSGLENVRIRVATYNGKMNIYSSPGKGTEINIEIEPS
ncbi:MAG: sensor histidine kinase [Prevotellaceae bacterium]|jgi:signal transduction histidine kinase|nr:sensor histidine kinase [Prevotellaceae bacterium]